jgi:hypothetical protein
LADEVRVRVQTYSGHQADERPVRLWVDGCEQQVLTVVRRSYEPGGARFRVLCSDGRTYDLLLDQSSGQWELLGLGACCDE